MPLPDPPPVVPQDMARSPPTKIATHPIRIRTLRGFISYFGGARKRIRVALSNLRRLICFIANAEPGAGGSRGQRFQPFRHDRLEMVARPPDRTAPKPSPAPFPPGPRSPKLSKITPKTNPRDQGLNGLSVLRPHPTPALARETSGRRRKRSRDPHSSTLRGPRASA